MKNNSSGGLGFFGVVIGAVMFLILRRTIPSLANLMLFAAVALIVMAVLLVAFVIYVSSGKTKRSAEEEAAEKDLEILRNGKKNLTQIRLLASKVKHSRIRTLCVEVCGSVEKVFRELKEQPEEIPSLRQFFHYYLPTLEKIITKYIKLESGGVPTEEITESTIACLEDIKIVVEKQYQSLFDDDILDLTVEMEVLTQMCKRDGLLTEDDF